MSTEDLKKLIGELKGEHVMEWESIDQCVEILEKIKDTEDDEEIKVIKKVVIFIKKTYDSGRETYILPEELEYLNDLYLPEEVSEEEEMNAEIKELLKDDNNYDKICEALKTAETKLNTFIKKSNETINKKKTVIFNLAAKKEVLERGVKDTVILKQIRRARELAAKLKDIEENHK